MKTVPTTTAAQTLNIAASQVTSMTQALTKITSKPTTSVD